MALAADPQAVLDAIKETELVPPSAPGGGEVVT